MWLVFGILTTVAWGTADLFYKKGSNEKDSLTQFKIVVMVGLVMGVHALLYMIHMAANGESFAPSSLIIYLPVSAMYILSMACGYVGLRYVELSISSPVQNSSGALVALMCFLLLKQTLSDLQLVATVLICAGVFMLSVLEKREDDKLKKAVPETSGKKKISGATAMIFPLLYCLIDAAGTFLDDIWLNEDHPKLSEDNALVAYELTFLFCGFLAYLYITKVKKEKFVWRDQKNRAAAALFETAGQFFYVFIIGGSGIIVAPLVSAYCVISMIFSRIFLREKLSKAQYTVAAVVVMGIVLLAVAEEM